MRAWKLMFIAAISTGLDCGPAEARDMPDKAMGIWANGSCQAGEDFFLLNSSAALLFRTAEGTNGVVFARAASEGDGVLLSRPEGSLLMLDTDDMTRCTALPSRLYASFGEALSLFKGWSDVETTCRSRSASRCVKAALQLVDVSSDKRVSQAEIGRLMRGAAFFIGYELALANRATADAGTAGVEDFVVDISGLYSAAAVASLVSPTVSGSFLASYDYDGDGFLSVPEILQDRDQESMIGLMQTAEGAAMQVALQQLMSLVQKMSGNVLGGWLFR